MKGFNSHQTDGIFFSDFFATKMTTIVDWPVQALTDYFPSLPQEKAMDYVIATIIAILFPIVRYILDKTVYHVR
jgi:hypothetical protein